MHLLNVERIPLCLDLSVDAWITSILLGLFNADPDPARPVEIDSILPEAVTNVRRRNNIRILVLRARASPLTEGTNGGHEWLRRRR